MYARSICTYVYIKKTKDLFIPGLLNSRSHSGPPWMQPITFVVVLRHNALRDTLVHFLHRAHASVQVEVGAGLFPDHSQSRPADILLQNWNLGRPVALDISVVSPLNPSTLAEAGATFGAVLEATESRKHQANDEKCSALGWVSTPLAVDSYGAWGKEATLFLAQVAARLAIHKSLPKSQASFDLFSNLSICLIRANARAILRRV